MERKDVKALMVDDEKAALDLFTRLLGFHGIKVKTASDGDSALALAKAENFDIVFLDVSLPKCNGFELMKELKIINPKSRYVMMTGYSPDDFDKEIKENGVVDFLEKPFQISVVLACIDRVCAEKKQDH